MVNLLSQEIMVKILLTTVESKLLYACNVGLKRGPSPMTPLNNSTDAIRLLTTAVNIKNDKEHHIINIELYRSQPPLADKTMRKSRILKLVGRCHTRKDLNSNLWY